MAHNADLAPLAEPNKRFRRLNPLWPTLQSSAVQARPFSNDIWAAIIFIGNTLRYLYKGYVTQFVFYKYVKDHRFNDEEYLEYELASYRPSLITTFGIVSLCCFLSFLTKILTVVAPRVFYRAACLIIAAPGWIFAWSSITSFFTRVLGSTALQSGFYLEDDESSVFLMLLVYNLLVAGLYWVVSGERQMAFASLTNKAVLQFKTIQILDFVSISLSVLFVWYSCGVVVLASDALEEGFLGVFLWGVHMLWFGSVANNVTKAYATGIAARTYLGMHEEVEEGGVALDSFISALKAFGTICFGSLVTTLATVLHLVLSSVTRPDRDDNIVVAIFKVIIRMIASYLEDWVKRFNRYALTYAVATGQPYLESTEKAAEVMDHFPALEKAVWGHAGAQSLLTGWLSASVASGAVLALGLGPAAVVPAALGSFYITHTSSSSSNEGFPTAQFICRSEKRLYLERGQSQYAPELNDHAARERVLDMIEEFEAEEAEKLEKKKKKKTD